MTDLQSQLNENQDRLNDTTQETGASNWLKGYHYQGYDFNKQHFWDCFRLRNGWRLANILSTCSCGSKMDIQHVMSCVYV